MGRRFVSAILPNNRIDDMKYRQAKLKGTQLLNDIESASNWTSDDKQDWVDDKAAELLHDMPSHFWEEVS
ncbi:hypothetical protein Q4539_09950 [Yoonia sp. 1_MG-2023]|nr:hypothetical protein [Yoonia sp. 1_MG-2023]